MDMSTSPVVGAWRVISCELEQADGTILKPWGEHPLGMAVFTSNGYVVISFMGEDRSAGFDADALRDDTTRHAAAFRTFYSYCATWEFDGETLTHKIFAGLSPARTGDTVRRTVTLNGDRATLVTPFENRIDQPDAIGRIVFERTN
jgi:hypothetical protein